MSSPQTSTKRAQIYPMQVTLRLTRATRIGHHPAATVCQLLKSAAGRMGISGMPANLVPDAIEVGRTELRKDSEFRFGITLWDHSLEHCRQFCDRLVEAIGDIGRSPSENCKHRKIGLGGNFQVADYGSLMETESVSPVAVPDDWFLQQEHLLQTSQHLTLRWVTPLCASLPKRLKTEDNYSRFFDSNHFPIVDLANRLIRRLREQVGIELGETDELAEVNGTDIRLLQPPGLERLHWIKWQYGKNSYQKSYGKKSSQSQTTGATRSPATGHNPRNRISSTQDVRSGSRQRFETEKSPAQRNLYGVMGRVVVQVRHPDLLRALVIGQYTHVGEKTNYGLGRYVIEEVQQCHNEGGSLLPRATRSVSLAQAAFSGPWLDQESDRLNVAVASVRKRANEIVNDDFQPQPGKRFLLPGSNGSSRLISVPSRQERVLQRAIYEQLYPQLDRFLTDSCIAYRRGLGRQTAAARIQKFFQEGWRWALKADFHHFFDSVDHRILQDKLEVFVQDDKLVELLMSWVRAGAPRPGIGLPTGAVISPLLANLFLAEFDHTIRNDSGRLIRYGDDFVILFRDPAKGRSILEHTNKLARQLHLHLNDEKTKLLDLDKTPFDYLGYRFFCEKGWQYRGDGLVEIEDLGWHQAPKSKSVPSGCSKKFPGESGLEPRRAGSWIVGPQIDWIGIESKSANAKDIVCRNRSLGTENRFQLRRVGELIVLGTPTLDQSLFQQRDNQSLQILMADNIGRWTCALTDEPPLELPQLVTQQVYLAADEPRKLGLARSIVSAKLKNYATLASHYPLVGRTSQLSEQLHKLSADALLAENTQTLLGIEGAGAAKWYREFGLRINPKFKFQRRVHPDASDPINVMLNITQTLLHRMLYLLLVREGFAPSIGILHQPGRRHAALASDLQEMYRHLMDRVVIEVSYVLSPGEFHEVTQGPFQLRIEPGAYRTLIAHAFKMLSTSCVASSQQASKPYRRHMATTVSSLHRHLLNPEAKFKIFEHIL